MSIAITLLALLIEATLGYPDRVLRAIGHPVMWLGRMIDWLDVTLNRDTSSGGRRKAAGFAAAFLIVFIPAAAAYAVESSLLLLPYGFVIVAILASSLIAQRSLYEHVERVATALERDGLDGGRRAVSQIVGRDPDALDEAGVARAAIESLAENFSDGVVAPVFWLAVGGLAGRRGLQGDQHRRQHDRPPHAAPRRFRLRRRKARRSRQPAGVAALRAADRSLPRA